MQTQSSALTPSRAAIDALMRLGSLSNARNAK